MAPKSVESVSVESWDQNRKLVIDRLDRMTQSIEKLEGRIGGEVTEMKVEIATMKAKVGLYAAAIGTVISILFSALIAYLTRR